MAVNTKHCTKLEREIYHNLRIVQKRIYDLDLTRKKDQYAKRQELQRIAIVIMLKLPKYKPLKEWWL